MQSNEITLEVVGSCLQVANQPLANNNYFLPRAGIAFEDNVMINDSSSTGTGAIESGIVSVIYYTVNDSTYFAGETAILYNTNNEKTAIFSLASDGTVYFQSISGYLGDIPRITYTITEEGGGSDSAEIEFIFLDDFVVNTFASCTSYPIEIYVQKVIGEGIEGLDTDPSHYNFYRRDRSPIADLNVEYDLGENAITLTFYDAMAGNNTYVLEYLGEQVASLTIPVSPAYAYWVPVDSTVVVGGEWNKTANWVSPNGSGVPSWCTDVTIPDNALYYPFLSDSVGECRDITFESRASVGQVHKLLYRNAYVEYTPEIQQWSMISAPLKYMYSADYQADESWGEFAGIEPRIYMRYFNVEYSEGNMENPDSVAGVSVGSFSIAFSSLKEELYSGQSFVLNFGENNSAFSGTYEFPRRTASGEDITYMYHYTDNGEWIRDDSAGERYAPFNLFRGNEEPMTDSEWETQNILGIADPWGSDNRYRFIYENTDDIETTVVNNKQVMQVNIKLNPKDGSAGNAGETVAVGNPFMSHIDFNSFYEDNSDLIQPYYRVFDGTNYHSYLATNSSGNPIWTNNDSITSTADGVYNNLIPPMQSFLVDLIASTTTLRFIPDNISTVPDYISALSSGRKIRKNNKGTAENILKLHLKINEKENTAILASLPLASDSYNQGEDVYKLFADEKSILSIKNEKFYPVEIYTVSDNTAIAINAVSTEGKEKIIPIGIRSKQTGSASITVEGIDNFKAFPELYLIDAKENISYDLHSNPTIHFEKSSEENVEGRFYIQMKQTDITTGFENTVTDDVYYFVNNGTISISVPAGEILNVELYDTTGRLIYHLDNINSKYQSISPDIKHGTYIIKTQTTTVTNKSAIIL